MTSRGRYSSSSASGTGLEKDHYRIVVLGSTGVGKTSIINQFLYQQFNEQYMATVEEMYRGEYQINGKPLILDILDTSGTHDFPAMRELSIRTGDAFVLVYAIDSLESFEDVKRLREGILSTKKETAEIPIVIVGNKSDLHERCISKEEADAIASVDWGSGYIESSAKDDVNIIGIFKALLNQMHVNYSLSPAFRRRRESTPVMDSEGRVVSRRTSLKPAKACVIS